MALIRPIPTNGQSIPSPISILFNGSSSSLTLPKNLVELYDTITISGNDWTGNMYLDGGSEQSVTSPINISSLTFNSTIRFTHVSSNTPQAVTVTLTKS